MKTAVEWYAEKSGELELKRTQGDISLHELVIELSNLLQRAKEMEKEQIEDSWQNGIENCGEFNNPTIVSGKQYYDQKFKSE